MKLSFALQRAEKHISEWVTSRNEGLQWFFVVMGIPFLMTALIGAVTSAAFGTFLLLGLV